MSNVVDQNGLDELFNLTDSIDKPQESVVAPTSPPLPPIKNDKELISAEYKLLMQTANSILDKAHFLVSSSTDDKTVNAAANVINAVTNLISQSSKSISSQIRFEQLKELEMLKTANKKQLIEHKAKQLPSKTNININGDINVPTMPFIQEQIVRALSTPNHLAIDVKSSS